MATVEVTIEADASEAFVGVTKALRETSKLVVSRIVDAWCPDLNQYARSQFVEELLDALL